MTKEQIKRGVGYAFVGLFLAVACVVLFFPVLLIALISVGGSFIIDLVETKDIKKSFLQVHDDISYDLSRLGR